MRYSGVFVFMLLHVFVQAQLSVVKKISFDIEKRNMSCLLNGEQELILLGLDVYQKGKPGIASILYYDNNLEQTDSLGFEIPTGYYFADLIKNENELYCFFSTYEKSPSYLAVRLNIPKKSIETKQGVSPKNHSWDDVKCLGKISLLRVVPAGNMWCISTILIRTVWRDLKYQVILRTKTL